MAQERWAQVEHRQGTAGGLGGAHVGTTGGDSTAIQLARLAAPHRRKA